MTTTDRLESEIEHAVDSDYFDGDVEFEYYRYNDDDPDMVAVITGPFANVHSVLQAITESDSHTADYIAHKSDGDIATRIGIDEHDDPSGTLFTKDV